MTVPDAALVITESATEAGTGTDDDLSLLSVNQQQRIQQTLVGGSIREA